jgi:hypothetical protein
MKRLFIVRNERTGKSLPETYHNKMAAKAARDALNATREGKDKYVVSYGPDHKRNQTNKEILG